MRPFPHSILLHSIHYNSCEAGAGRGIGLAASKLFVANGARVFLSDLNLTRAREELKDLGDSVAFMEADVSNEESVSKMCKVCLGVTPL